MSNQKNKKQQSNNRKKTDTKKVVLAALLTAMVVILQLVGSSIRFGMFSISLVLIPIVVGAATCGPAVGAWLGLTFGVIVLLSGDAAPFMALSVPGTIITVIVKGVACGYLASLMYKLVFSIMQKRAEKKIEYFVESGVLCANCKDGMYRYVSRNSQYVAVMVAAIVCPVVNTGVFLLGCVLFFFNDIMPKDANTWEIIKYMVFTLVGGNFIFELATNIILGPAVVRLINFRNKNN